MVKIRGDPPNGAVLATNGKSQESETNGCQNLDKDNKSDLADEVDARQNGGATAAATAAATSDASLPEAKLELVDKVRQLLKREFKEQPEAYSRVHYDEIMDERSPNTCWRYLLQRDEDVDQALELAKSALAWRQENRIDALRPSEMIKDFWLRAPIGFLGKSKGGKDLIYAIGKNFKKPDAMVKQTIRDFISYLLFSWDREHKDDLAQMELVFDVTDTGLRNIDLDFASWLVSIRDMVPARISAIYFVGIPFLMRPIIRLIISWLPARFKKIAHCGTYDQLVRANVADECIPEEIGGKADNRWRLAPVESQWAHEIDDPQAERIFKEICDACSFNTTQEYLDKVYKMQRDYEQSLKIDSHQP